MIRIVSWNVAGLRACMRKGFYDVIRELDPDIFCLQEVKATPQQVDLAQELSDYEVFWNPAKRAGYSGTLIASRLPVNDQLTDFGYPEHATEGRSITVGVNCFYLVNAYVPNSQEGLKRLPYRMEWERDFRDYLTRINTLRPVIFCGDLNVAHREIDIARPHDNHFSPGFSDEERAAMTELLSVGFVDTFRALHGDVQDVYSYWSYLGNARSRNVGWRLDYFLASEDLVPCIERSEILTDILGSDHCPILLDIRE